MKHTYSEVLRVVGVPRLDGPALLAAIVCMPLSLYADWIPAVLCGAALLVQHWSWTSQVCQDAKTSKDKAKDASLRSRFTVCAAVPADAAALASLYEEDYLQAHRHMHEKPAAGASIEEWQAALGPIDFPDVLMSNSDEVRLLKLQYIDDSGEPSVVGYILYELREKGPHGKRRQRFCELVNIVVHSKHRGCGAGRLLFEALCDDVASKAPSHMGDLRLFVAERNTAPRAWYKRLGFTDAGWETECVGGADVRFLRMMFKPLGCT